MFFKSAKPASIKRVVYILLLIFILSSHLPAQVIPKGAVGKKKVSSESNTDRIQIPQGLSPQEIDAHLASMSDEQARQVLAQKLKQEAAANAQSKSEAATAGPLVVFHRFAEAAAAVLKRIGSVFSVATERSDQWDTAIDKLSGGKGPSQLLWTLFGMALIIACGLILKKLFMRATSSIQEQLLKTMHLGKLEFFGRVLSRMLLNAAGVGIYVFATFIFFVLVYQKGEPGYFITSVYLIVSYYVMFFAFVATTIFAPGAPGLRLFPLQETDAAFLNRWIVNISIIAAVVTGTDIILLQAGISRQLYLLIYSAAGAVVILALMAMIWQSRHRVAQAIGGEKLEKGKETKSFGQRLAHNWHYLALLYVFFMGIYWVNDVFLEGDVTIVKLIASIFLIPVFIGLDQWGQRLLRMASGELPEIINLSEDEHAKPADEQQQAESKMNIKHYIPLIKRALRIVLIAFLFFIMLRLWGIDLSFGRIFTRTAFSILVTFLLGLITWEIIKARIDRKLREEMPEADENAEEGGAGGSRTGTLLILLRKFALTVLFVIVVLIILSSLGVNIGPLIAGAGVVGLAIGFGAQTLVKDIIAGVFFLIDDAFRVGDFIETGGTKGMVEHISLRSLRLRSPRGPVHTIPFGSMGTVTNNSRDYIITKLDFRVRYDTNVEKVRKIIKNINNVIMKDEEMGPNLLDKVKSQGVRELDDSAMIMRVKFKTIPGEQFVIRREVYRLIQEAFAENGIEFAHRNVTVYMPPGEGADAPDKKAVEAGAAAAIAAAQEQEAQKKKPKG
ncbi:MAG: mechanosensitive ion channel family protein [Desulfobacterales bacterium]